MFLFLTKAFSSRFAVYFSLHQSRLLSLAKSLKFTLSDVIFELCLLSEFIIVRWENILNVQLKN